MTKYKNIQNYSTRTISTCPLLVDYIPRLRGFFIWAKLLLIKLAVLHQLPLLPFTLRQPPSFYTISIYVYIKLPKKLAYIRNQNKFLWFQRVYFSSNIFAYALNGCKYVRARGYSIKIKKRNRFVVLCLCFVYIN